MDRETKRTTIEIRPASVAEYQAIYQIYTYYIESTTHNWNDHPKPFPEFAAGLEFARANGRPALVAIGPNDGADDGTGAEATGVLGFALLHAFRAPAGYWPCVENSIYVQPGLRGNGIGSQLMMASIDQARATGVWAIIAVIDAANQASVRFHARHGFRNGGCLENIGEKNGAVLSAVFMQFDLPENRERFMADRNKSCQHNAVCGNEQRDPK